MPTTNDLVGLPGWDFDKILMTILWMEGSGRELVIRSTLYLIRFCYTRMESYNSIIIPRALMDWSSISKQIMAAVGLVLPEKLIMIPEPSSLLD